MTERTKHLLVVVRRTWPFIILIALASLFVLILFFSRKSPVIQSLDPAMASPGQNVILAGEYFGRTPRDGTLSLAGNVILPSSIVSWADKRIEFTIPPDAVSGLLTISNSQGVSKGVLFTNTDLIPTVMTQVSTQPRPLIKAILPAQVATGAVVTLRAGPLPEHSTGSFVRLIPPDGLPLDMNDFISWSSRQIRFRLPAGYGAGTTLSVHTPRGDSYQVPLVAISPIQLNDPKTYDLDFRIDTQIDSGTGDLLVWFALPDSAETGQPSILVSKSKEPLAGAAGANLPFLWNTVGKGTISLSLKVRVTSYDFLWVGWSVPVSGNPNDPGPLQASLGFGTRWDAAWPIASPVSSSDGNDPMTRAKKIYMTVVQRFKIVPGQEGLEAAPRAPQAVWDSQQATPLEAALTLASAARGAGFVSRLVAGFVVKDEKAVPHVWVELWIPSAGWVPEDPAEGILDQNPLKYFASQDNKHIAWSFGKMQIERLEAASKSKKDTLPFTFQNQVAETTGDLVIQPPVWSEIVTPSTVH